uniref:Reverse transcriptase domain-containing protein n=1 Tax=Tanacetum cinerariifolium TaxID=118510 RepID=A0A699I2D4_TANCI|nr:hypothetical protein [Tanacetum cinerariifolium]
MCGTKVCEEQKHNMEDTMLELLEDCRQKELYCMHNDVEDLIESALNSKLLSINLKSQCLDKEKQEVKNIVDDKNHFDAESDLIESFLTQDTLIVYSLKIDSLLEEFAGELVHINPIPPRINETNSDPKDDIRFIEQLLYDDTSSEDDSFKDIDYVEASPPDPELVSLEESPSSSFLSYSNNSLPEFKTFSDHIEETSSGSTTTHADNSLPEYDSFLFEIEPD